MENAQHNIKIFISYHKESEIIQSGILTPIQVGAKNSPVDLKMQRDDTGDNISEKNDRYCELTAQYWAWKNLHADYYDFMHYRRHFAFQDFDDPFDDDETIFYPRMDQLYTKEIGLEDETIRRCVGDSDLILPMRVNTMKLGAVSNEVQFSCLEYQHAADFDFICKLVTKIYPEYADAVQEFRMGHYAYFLNMFIMKKEIFVDYCEWLFRILEEAEAALDFTGYSQQELRVLAYMAERLLNIYIIKLLKDQPALKCKHLRTTLIQLSLDIRYFASALEKAYRELNQLSLPYDLEQLFRIKEPQLDLPMRDRRIMFYGGGAWCRRFLSYFDRLDIAYPEEIWDRDAKEGQTINGIPVVKPHFVSMSNDQDILWIITIYNCTTSDRIRALFSNCGVTGVVDSRTLIHWLSYQLWLRVKNDSLGEINEQA